MAGRKMGEDSAHCSWGLGGLRVGGVPGVQPRMLRESP
ncbi:hypothetical protein ANDA3_1818 [plant metagenome]|uniref:Uncharacterized protein n=1 Tax=plant metagenome TaxID=1297885 RepID=A0A484QGY9_9ZZZZ